MDPSFSGQLVSLHQGVAKRPIACPQDASVVINDINETITALVGIKRGFEKSRQDMDEARWDEQLREIDAKLMEMGEAPTYDALPPGFIDKKKFKERVDIFSNAMQNGENEIAKIQKSRGMIEENMGRSPQEKRNAFVQSLSHLDAQLEHWQTQLNGTKNCFIEFLQSNRPMNAVSFLDKKNKLLDQKLELLVKKRWKEAGLDPPPSQPGPRP